MTSPKLEVGMKVEVKKNTECKGVITRINREMRYPIEVRFDGPEWFYPQWNRYLDDELNPI